MNSTIDDAQQARREPDDDAQTGDGGDYGGAEQQFGLADFDGSARLRPINWNLLSADEALVEWEDLDKWVDWLRKSFGLPPAVIPPLWHRHDELVWELSALHMHWINSHDSENSPSAPIGLMRDFAEARGRLREWVSIAGCRIDRDRPTRQTVWPGEAPIEPQPEVEIVDRYADFVEFVLEDVAARRRIEERVMSGL